MSRAMSNSQRIQGQNMRTARPARLRRVDPAIAGADELVYAVGDQPQRHRAQQPGSVRLLPERFERPADAAGLGGIVAPGSDDEERADDPEDDAAGTDAEAADADDESMRSAAHA